VRVVSCSQCGVRRRRGSSGALAHPRMRFGYGCGYTSVSQSLAGCRSRAMPYCADAAAAFLSAAAPHWC
jgi:hypothetical protein